MNLNRIFRAYRDIISTVFAEAPVMVVCTFVFTIVSGLLTPLGVYINQNVFDGGIAVAMNKMPFSEYSIFLVLFVINAFCLPSSAHMSILTVNNDRSSFFERRTNPACCESSKR
jgi:hypothetical protein